MVSAAQTLMNSTVCVIQVFNSKIHRKKTNVLSEYSMSEWKVWTYTGLQSEIIEIINEKNKKMNLGY